MRIDKFIWNIRIVKTRTMATELCNAEKIKLNNKFIKPSKEVKVGDIVYIKESSVWRSFSVLNIPKSRLGAALVNQYIEETTSNIELNLLDELKSQLRTNKLLGISGRPTKKDRRNIDDFKNI